MIVKHSFYIMNYPVILRQDREQDTDALEIKCILTKLHYIYVVINCAVEEKILACVGVQKIKVWKLKCVLPSISAAWALDS